MYDDDDEDIDEVTHPMAVSHWPGKYLGNIGSDTLRVIFRDLLTFIFRKTRPEKVSLHIFDELTFELRSSEALQFEQGTDIDGKEAILLIEIAYNTPQERLIFLKLNALSDMMSIRFLLQGEGNSMILNRGARVYFEKTDVDGFRLRFRLARSVFGNPNFELFSIYTLLDRLSFCYPDCEFIFSDLRYGKAWSLHQPEGIKALFRYRLISYIPFHEPVVIDDVSGDIHIEIVFVFHTSNDTDIQAYVNGYRTTDDEGTHISGFVTGLVNAFNEMDEADKLGYDASRICRGLSAVISLRLPEEYVSWAPDPYVGVCPNMNFSNTHIGERIEMLTRERTIHELANNRRFGQLIKEGKHRHSLE